MQLLPGPKGTILSLVVLAVISLLPVATYLASPRTPSLSFAPHHMVAFNSYNELHQFLFTKSCNNSQSGNPPPLGVGTTVPAPATSRDSGQLSITTASAGSTPAYSQTNDQVAGVDELDTVKTDGQYIYTVTNNTIAIVLAYPTSQAKLVTSLSINGSIQGMFLLNNRLVVVTQQPPYPYVHITVGAAGGMTPQPSGYYPVVPWPTQSPTTSMWTFDVSNHSNPVLTTSLVVNGTLVGTRLIGSYVYLIATASVYCNGPIILPETIVNSMAVKPNISQVYHSDVVDSFHVFSSIVAVNLSDANPNPALKILVLGTSNTIYVAPHDIFLTQQIWNQTEATVVHRIHIDLGAISYDATGTVPGHVLNQFSMDQYNGYFRIATTDYPTIMPLMGASSRTVSTLNQQETNLYVMDDALHIYGKLEGLSPGEAFYAARFIGDRAYLVTYQRMDPLFVISLQDPSRPRVLGQLNVSGVSDYLQPYDDETHLIGFGQSSINMTWENAALFQGLKVSLFDVSDPNHPTETSRYLIGDRGSSSPALSDHKSILFDHALNLLVIPVEIALLQDNMTTWQAGSPRAIGTMPVWQCNPPEWQGAYVFKVTLDNGIVFRGGITHLKTGDLPSWTNQDSFVMRSLYIGNVLYTISNNMVKLNSLTDLSEISSVHLNA